MTGRLLVALEQRWGTIFPILCVIAVSVDPLFFYLPFIDEEIKCLGMDENMRIAALVLRSLADVAFILNIIYQVKNVVREAERVIERRNQDLVLLESTTDKIIWFTKKLVLMSPLHSVIIDILAVFPVPQVLMTVFFNMRSSSNYQVQIKIMDFFLLAQCLPRIYRMHRASAKFRQQIWGIWIIGAFYFFLYILASHVVGAFWYFLSIQRETTCWHRACIKHGPKECNFYCNKDISSRNMTFIKSLDKFCLIDVPANATAPFDFGIYLNSLTSGNAGQINFMNKFLYSFWWGLRNLSTFGTNLETSTSLLENCFSILISISGLLLFLYLIGNVQIFISLNAQRSIEKAAETEKLEQIKMSTHSAKMDLLTWMFRKGFDQEIKNDIMLNLDPKWRKIQEFNVENLFYILPVRTRNSMRRFLCMEILRKVTLTLKTEIKKEEVLTSICDVLKPKMYPDNSFVFRMGEPLDRILLITEGSVWIYHNFSSSSTQDGDAGTSATPLGKGAYYGDELLSWASDRLASLDNVPMAKANVKCHGKVEGFVVMAKDLNIVLDRYKFYWCLGDPRLREEAAIQAIQKARRFKLKPKKDQQKVQQSEPPIEIDDPPTSAVMLPPPGSSVTVEVPSDDTTTVSS